MDSVEHKLWEEFLRQPAEENFTPLYEHTKGLVYTISLRLLMSEDDAYDAFQNAYARLLLIARTGTPARPHEQGMARLAVLEADALRKRRKRRSGKETVMEELPETVVDAVARDNAAAAELRAKIEALATTLPDDLRVPVMLHYFDGLSHQQIADALNLPRGTVTSRLRAALKKLEPMMRRAGLGDALTVLGGISAGAALILPPAKATAAGVYATASQLAAQGSFGTATATTVFGVKAKIAVAAAVAILCLTISFPSARQAVRGIFKGGSGTTSSAAVTTITSTTAGSTDADGPRANFNNSGGTSARATQLASSALSGGFATPADELASGTLRISGKLLYLETKLPAADIEMFAIKREGDTVAERRTRTDANGHFDFEALPAGMYQFNVEAGDYRLAKPGPVQDETMMLLVSMENRDFFLFRGNLITGNVRNHLTSEPVPGVVVKAGPYGKPIEGATGVTDENGNYRISGITLPQVWITTHNEDYVLYQEANPRPILVSFNGRNDEKEVNLEVQPLVQISGRILRANDRPVPDATVEWRADGAEDISGKSARDGSYTLKAPAFTTGSVRAYTEDHPPTVSKKVSIKLEPVMGVDVILHDAGEIRGVVLAPDGSPVADAEVASWQLTPYSENSEWHDEFPRVKTNKAGEFRIENLTPTTIHLRARGGEHASSLVRKVELDPGETKKAIELQLRKGLPFAGMVVDESGKPIAGAMVHISLMSANEYFPFQTTGEDGRFRFTGLVSSPLYVSVNASQYEGRGIQDLQPGDENVRIVLKMPGEEKDPELLLIGTVLDAQTGDIIEGFSVTNQLGQALPNITYDKEAKGLFTLPLSSKSTHQLKISAPGYTTHEAFIVPNRYPLEDYRTFKLEPLISVSGRVVSAINGRPIPNVVVSSFGNQTDHTWQSQSRNASPLQAARTDSDGRYTLGGVPRGRNTVTFEPPEPYSRVEKAFDVQLGMQFEDVELVVRGGLLVEVITASGEIIAGLQVNLWRDGEIKEMSEVTDQSGIASFTGLDEGDYWLGYENRTANKRIEIKDDVQREKVVVGSAVLRGSVRRNGSPTAAKISGFIFSPDPMNGSEQIRKLNTDAQGQFELKYLEPGSRVILDIRTNEAPNKALLDEVLIPASGTLAREFNLPTGIVTGRVIDAEGEPISAADVRATELMNLEYRSFRHLDAYNRFTDGGGKFEFTDLMPGNHRFSAMVEGLGTATVEAIVPEHGTEHIELVIDSGKSGSLIINATEEAGRPLIQFDAEVMLGDETIRRATGLQPGRLEIKDLAPGTYRVVVRGSDMVPETRSGVEINSGASSTLNFSMKRGGYISWRIENEHGMPDRFATIRLKPLGDDSTMHISANPAKRGPLTPGQYQFTAESNGKTNVDEVVTVTAGGTVEITRRMMPSAP